MNDRVTPQANFELISPEEAREILRRSEDVIQRGRNQRRVSAAAADIMGGRWQMNGQPIILDTNGRLLDGQHRLAAIVAAGRPINTLVVRGVSPRCFESIDTGKSRTISQVLAMRGYKNTSTLGSTLGQFERARHRESSFDWLRNHLPTPRQLLRMAKLNPDISTACNDVRARGATKQLRCATPLSFVRAVTLRIDSDLSDQFFSEVYGDADCLSSAVTAFRRRMFRDAAAMHHIAHHVKVVLAIQTWNNFYSGTSVVALRPKESYPEIAGATEATYADLLDETGDEA